ncbi:uncharacterized protein LOC128993164 [Macrosteles quadrilineatus]|uniref:uncharacterized protein LOC128993164 n=1 Tax=Macrosteles quadrilineatus TaxID=74068 RepID=UPI0023E19D20|nr:uncharacterized protein LOC128993164 [Macrosteles quadrilineatus]
MLEVIKPRTGIVGIERSIQEKHKQTDKNISAAFQDLSKLMTMAKDMVHLAKNISDKIRMEITTSGQIQNNIGITPLSSTRAEDAGSSSDGRSVTYSSPTNPETCARSRPFSRLQFLQTTSSSSDRKTGSSSEISICSSPERSDTDLVNKSPLFKKRRNFCPFCRKLGTNFSRHLIRYHSDEDEMKEYLALSDASPHRRKVQRALITQKIRNAGNNIYNNEVVNGKIVGKILPVKRSSNRKYSANNLTHVECKHCLGMFKKQSLYRHIANCKQYSPDESSKQNDTRKGRKDRKLAQHSSLLARHNANSSDLLKRDVFPKMQRDSDTLFAQGDRIITRYGSNLRFNHRTDRQIYYCSSKMRTLARLFYTMKKTLPELKEFQDCLNPRYFNTLVDSVRKMSGFDAASGNMKTPSVSPRLCSALKSCANIVKSDAIKDPVLTDRQKVEIIDRADKFLFLIEKDWATEVGSISEKSRKQLRVVKENLLPDEVDIVTFSEYLAKLCPHYTQRLKEIPTVGNYEKLAKLVIAHIITLNRRRPNETVEIPLEAYQTTLNREVSYGHDVQSVVSEEEFKNGQEMSIFYIPGNKNIKKVPTLLRKMFHEAVETLIESREKIGITSKYLFGRLGDPELFSGSVVLKELVKKVNLKKPSHFTANSLRHHAATSSQLHHRNDTYTKRLSQFMGHDLKTHEQYYEMPLPLIQQYVVGSRLLEMTLPTPSTSATITSGALNGDSGPSDETPAPRLSLSPDIITEESTSSSATVTSGSLTCSSSTCDENSVPGFNFPFVINVPTEVPKSSSETVTSGSLACSSSTDKNQWFSFPFDIDTPTDKTKSLSATVTSGTPSRLDTESENASGTHSTLNQTPTSGSNIEPDTEPAKTSVSSPPQSIQIQTPPRPVQNTPRLSLTPSPRSNANAILTAVVDPLQSQSPRQNNGASKQSFPAESPKVRHTKVRWSTAEKNVIYEKLGRYFITDATRPTRNDIKLIWEHEETLKNRTLQQVVTFVNNILTKKQTIPTSIMRKIESMISEGRAHLDL